MAHIISTDPITLGATVTVNSFGHDYSAIVLELKPRTALIQYTNKSGNEWTLRVKRTDVADPTARQKAGTALSVEVRKLRKLFAESRHMYNADWVRQLIDRGLAGENTRREKAWNSLSTSYGRREERSDYPHLMPLDEAGFAAEVADWIDVVHEQAVTIDAARDRLIELGKL